MIILKKACIRYEPNDPEFIRITHRTYEVINEACDFDVLHSTRYFGPMVFYLVWYKKVQNLVAYMLNKANLSDCVDVVKLYSIVHPNDVKDIGNKAKTDVELVKV